MNLGHVQSARTQRTGSVKIARVVLVGSLTHCFVIMPPGINTTRQNLVTDPQWQGPAPHFVSVRYARPVAIAQT